MQETKIWDTAIIGSGPAGLTAALYTSRANLSTICLAGDRWGGQLMLTSEVENYPGFPEGILGPDLMQNMRKQAERFGVSFVDKNVTKTDFSDPRVKKVYVGDEVYLAKTVILATGADTKWLGLPNEQRLIGKGVSSCAPCDAFFFKDKKVLVIGGGDAAMEEALTLTKFATEITIVHRRDAFRASQIMQDRVKANTKIKVIWNTEVVDILGKDKVEGVKLKTIEGGNEKVWDLAVDGVFVAIGHNPNTAIFTDNVKLDEKGYILRGISEEKDGIHPYKSSTSIPGIFAAGDAHDHKFRQAVTAAAYGCEAALEVERWLVDKGI